MTTDQLKQRLMQDYGFSATKVDNHLKSMIFLRAVEILCNDGEKPKELYTVLLEQKKQEFDQKCLEREQSARERENVLFNSVSRLYELNYKKSCAENELKELNEQIEARKQELAQLNSETIELETAEARDRVRMYYLFKHDADQSQGKTYNAGLAAILAGCPIYGNVKEN